MSKQLEAIKSTLLGIPPRKLQFMVDTCAAITDRASGSDGAGLASGTIIDWAIQDFFRKVLPEFAEHRRGEADFVIAGQPLSFKRLKGKSLIAMHWSKNPEEHREYWKHPILLMQQTSGQWWKKRDPAKPPVPGIDWKKTIPQGFYLIDNEFGKETVVLESNNKSNSVVNVKYLYVLLLNAYENGLYVETPGVRQKIEFDLINFPDDEILVSG